MDMEQEVMEMTKKLLDETYKVVLEGDVLEKAAKVAKKYVEELEKQGFSRLEAISIASRFSVGK